MATRSNRSQPSNPFFPYVPENKKGVWEEIHHLLYFAAAIVLIAALVSYSASDPSWSTWTTKNAVQNWMGRLGSMSADLAYLVFGLGAFCFPFLLIIAGVKRQADEAQDDRLWSIGALLFVVSTTTLFHVLYPATALPWNLNLAGGLVGRFIYHGLLYPLGWLGALVLGVFGFISSLIILFEWRPFSQKEMNKKEIFWSIVKSPMKLYLVVKSAIQKIPPVRIRIPKFWKKQVEAPSDTFLSPAPIATTPTEAPSVTSPISPAEVISFVEHPRDEDFAHIEDAEEKVLRRPKQLRMPLATKNFQLPSADFLSGRSNRKERGIDKQWYIDKGKLLVEKLADFGVDGEIVNVAPGPVITVYEFKPASGIKIREIANLSDDLTLALSVLSVRIVAPIPGKPVVGIEIPTPEREMVFFKDIVQETPFYKSDRRIPIALGRLASGEPILTDLAAMPHLLVAGATGTGKSVFVNTLICSLLYRFAPQQLKLILVDPKMVELSHYEGIPHLMLPVVVDAKKAVLALRWLIDEMERRYHILHKSGVRHVDSYNAKLNELQKQGEALDLAFMPYIVTVIDEYADLMAVVPKEVEHSVARLAQKARASGIHMVLATQRPSTDVVTGTIKANFPSRISFRVASGVDSKTILDRPGAERLLGNGDMLFHSAGFNTLKRMQGSYIEDADLDRVISHLKAQAGPDYDEAILANLEESMELEESEGGDGGSLYDQAVRIVTDRGEASISLLQRHLKIGYNRAATLMEQMEKEGVVGAAAGPAKRRSVLVGSL